MENMYLIKIALLRAAKNNNFSWNNAASKRFPDPDVNKSPPQSELQTISVIKKAFPLIQITFPGVSSTK